MNLALYFGTRPSASNLLETNAGHLPLEGTTASGTVPFGDRVLTLVMSPKGSIAGALAEYLAWAIAALGGAATIAGALSVERLLRRREGADARAALAEKDLGVQRALAVKLQRSFLPAHLPAVAGLEAAVSYLPGAEGVEVGGDWYDVMDVEGGAVFFSIGDVVGRGLDAATTMASLRHAIGAHAVAGAWPHEALARVQRLVDVAHTGRFATVVCGRLDMATGRLALANAGHPVPVAVTGSGAHFLDVEPGPPVGVGTEFRMMEWHLEPGTTLLLYTDGLVERRGESLEEGLERLRRAAAGDPHPERVLERVVTTLVPDGTTDDVAVMALRWTGWRADGP